MKKRIEIVFSSHLTPEINLEFSNHISKTIGVPHDVYIYPNFNQYSLSEIYNKAINENNFDKESIVVFAHNDIIFKTKDWGKKLLKHFNSTDYSIIGVAGTTYMSESGRWWDRRERMIGIVEHTNGIRNWVSEYCKPFYGVKPAVIIDGLFMAVDLNNLVHTFDESFKGYHFYDISFCYPNFLDGIDIGVISDIRILHKSMGMTNNEWELNRQQFAKMYANELPYDILNEK